MKHFVACFLVIIGAMAAFSARADFTLNYGVLTCDGTRALIRFAIAPNYDAPAFPDPPDEIDFGLTVLPRADGNICALSDGREVKVKMGNRQPFPYGMCGGRDDASMSLWVDGRKVISRREVTFSCVGNRRGEVIVLNDRRLTICQSFAPEDAIGFEAPLRFECNDATRMLEMAEPDPIEYPAEGEKQPALGSMTIPFAESISFCQGFIGSEPKPKSEDLWR